ncbi:hypothetical protein FNV43_RR09696 [Rhamnella rubrinervis]|uniref:Uncharacterized protein n=1 Tax=Rhamnella rubrinervis TaxID=2594499 RepID=A0A8K0MK75_9ROSA|nr:hypothetical protein FNV43_RR09696 [Rhamnella rubrinervis]
MLKSVFHSSKIINSEQNELEEKKMGKLPSTDRLADMAWCGRLRGCHGDASNAPFRHGVYHCLAEDLGCFEKAFTKLTVVFIRLRYVRNIHHEVVDPQPGEEVLDPGKAQPGRKFLDPRNKRPREEVLDLKKARPG